MLKLLKNAEQIVTVNTGGVNFKRGTDLKQIDVLTSHSILIEEDLIKDILPNSSIKNISDYQIIDLKNKIVLPGLVECHTHTAFAGSRASEYRLKLNGATYEDIAKQGGGINSTVNAVRETSLQQLLEIIKPRILHFISQGITTLEIKSGYGLDFENEMKLLKAINYLNEFFPINIIPTFLGAHTFPFEYKNDRNKYIELICGKMIPYIAENKLAKFCDGFCEQTAFSPGEIDIIFSAAKSYGMKLRLHTDQFNSIGGVDTALKHKAVSVDHLEMLDKNDVEKFAGTDTTAVLLPGVSFFLNYQYAPARNLIDNNSIIALSTDYNPGSSNIPNLHFIMHLAAAKMNMKIEETISAVTINAAKVLNVNENAGSIELNKKADFAVFDTVDYSDIVYTVGKNLNSMTIKNGNIIYKAG
jgi:imidazolonepropionase